MRRILLDTNIYEFILKEIDREVLHNLVETGKIAIYGNDIVRKELRDLPRGRCTKKEIRRSAVL